MPVYGRDSMEEDNLRRIFNWQTRVGLGPKFGSRPVGWYQQVQMCALEAIEGAAEAKLGGSWRKDEYEVRLRGDEILARRGRKGKYRPIADVSKIRKTCR